MKLKIPNNLIYQVLFVLCVMAPYFYNYELTFSIWVLSAAITISRKYSLTILKQIACFAGILLIACIMMFYHQYKIYYIVRDFTYLIKPILGLLVGYQIAKKVNGGIFRLIVVTGVIVAILHYILLFNAVVFLNARDTFQLREYAGYFSDYEVYALVLLIFYKKFDLPYSRRIVFILACLIAFSSFLYLARTNFIQFIILFMALKGYFKINRRSIIIVSSIVTALLIGYSTILYINPKRNGQGFEAILYKIKIAPTEPFKTRLSRDNWKEFNDNYRSYENIMTVRQVGGDGASTVLFGRGLGSTIDLRIEVWLGGDLMRYISILHNGFMTVFLKSGLLGVSLYIISIFLLFKIPVANNSSAHVINEVMIGTGVYMIISAWVFMGLYFLADTKSILIGMLICGREYFNRQTP